MKKGLFLKRGYTLTLLLLAALVFLLYVTRSRTPSIRGDYFKIIPESVASLEQVEIGGWNQTILIRGKDTSNPILLFLHGGPGMPMMYLSHEFQKPLEERFIVVHWDQRGAGKSYSKDVPVGSMHVEQFLSDTRELIQMLKERFGKEKIFLVGHSWGSYLGMLVVDRNPELFYAFVGMGQVVDTEQGYDITDRFLQKRAKQMGRFKALQEITTKGDQVREKWLFKFGFELYGKKSWMPFVWTGLFSPEYGLFDIPKIPRGSSFSSMHMKYNAIEGELLDEITEVDVPVYFFTGRYDLVTPYQLVEQYHEKIKAPKKKLVWFENSAHFPFFEEPGRFTEEMLNVLDDTYHVQKAKNHLQKGLETLKEIKLSVVYDNIEHKSGLRMDWGFGCVVETGETTLLFDTGGDSSALLGNMKVLRIDPEKIEAVFLSHFHGDHTKGLQGLLKINKNLEVSVPAYFPADFKKELKSAGASVMEYKHAGQIGKGLYTTGEMGTGIIEQSLIADTSKGLIVITGCAHPGILEVIKRAKELFDKDVYLILGGFHLNRASRADLEQIIDSFKQLGVQKVAPSHCSGDLCRSMLQEAYGEDFIETGAGKVIETISLQ
jgi:metal-dependent hydrolase (beta-lactamase superfamily II)/pimeloyl-ACP methyl ester carboxylesterase